MRTKGDVTVLLILIIYMNNFTSLSNLLLLFDPSGACRGSWLFNRHVCAVLFCHIDLFTSLFSRYWLCLHHNCVPAKYLLHRHPGLGCLLPVPGRFIIFIIIFFLLNHTSTILKKGKHVSA